MANWMCQGCGYRITGGNHAEVETPPEKCPGCGQVCAFVDVTCYIPNSKYGCQGNIDQRLVASFGRRNYPWQ